MKTMALNGDGLGECAAGEWRRTPDMNLRFDWSTTRDGGRLTVTLLIDADAEKPALWAEMKAWLRARGFRLEDGDGLEAEEIFLPSTFFSGHVGIEGGKRYDMNATELALNDLSSILDWAGSLGMNVHCGA